MSQEYGGLQVFYTNTCSLLNKWDELTVASSECDIIALTETWLKEDDPLHKMVPTGFCMYRADRPNNRIGGGALLLVRDDIPQSLQDSLVTPTIQLVSCRIRGKGSNLTIACVYRAPNAPDIETLALMEHLNVLNGVGNKLILMGDFNASEINWADESAPHNSFGERLLEFVHDKKLFQHIHQVTRWRLGQKPSVLDLLITRQEKDIKGLEIGMPVAKSDHAVIRFQVNEKLPKPPNKSRRCFRRLNIDQLKARASALDWYPISSMGVGDRWEVIKTNLTILMNEFAPLRSLRRRGRPPWWGSKMERVVKRKRRMWAWFRRTRSHTRYLSYLEARRQADRAKTSARLKYEERLAREAKINPKAYFNYVQSKAGIRSTVGDIEDINKTPATSDQEKADRLLDSFQQVYRPDSGSALGRLPVLSTVLQPMESITISDSAVLKHLERVNAHKAAGPDGIHPAIVKPLASILSRPLTDLYRSSLENCELPDDWKKATIMPIHKGGSRSLANNYRPVSLTPILLKILEKIIRDSIASHLCRNGLVNPKQHGFMKKRSCQSNLICFLDEVTRRLDKGEEVEVCYLDFRKAFDSVCHRLLLLKLERIYLPESLLKWIRSFLEDTSISVAVGGAVSLEIIATSGVPQGSVLGPLLFLIYVDDLVSLLNNPGYMFADDVKIIGNPSLDSMQQDLDTVHQWTIQWDLPLNTVKCQRLIKQNSSWRARTIGDPLINTIIQDNSTVRDLGITMTGDFKASSQAKAASAKANRALYQLGKTVKSRKPEVLLPLYKMHVRPHLEYCVQAWSPFLKKDVTLLERTQRRFTRWFQPLRHLPYAERLLELNLFSLERRRKRGDLIETYKVLKGFTDIRKEDLFSTKPHVPLRGHSLQLFKQRSRLDIRAHSFANRVVSDWNSLPEDIVLAPSVRVFKLRLDAAWGRLFRDVT